MARSKQNSHEYYANYETCRNRMFDTFDPDELQNEDIHLSYKNALEDDIKENEHHGKKHHRDH